MTLQTSDERSLVVAIVKGNRFAVTGFDVRTPQDGATPDTMRIYAQSWVDRGDGMRVSVTDLEPIEYVGLEQIGPLLTRVGELYEEYMGASPAPTRAEAQYLALRDALNESQKLQNRFPADADLV